MPANTLNAIHQLSIDGEDDLGLVSLHDSGVGTEQTYELWPITVGGSLLERTNSGVSVELQILQMATLQAGNRDDGLRVYGGLVPGDIPVTFVAGAGTDTVIGPDHGNTWRLTAAGAGQINEVLYFDSVEELLGGRQADVFAFDGGVSGFAYIHGDSGTDELDYSLYGTSVQVNLSTGSATGVGGLSQIENLIGGSHNDVLIGDSNINVIQGSAGDDVLVGMGSDDQLFGQFGRDLLIGGTGSDLASGGHGEDILLGGSTTYDTNVTALDVIMAEWSRTGLTYADRVSVLESGSGWNGPNVYPLDVNNVFDDGKDDQLSGDDDLDWFWAFGDSVNDQQQGEVVY